MTTTDMPRAPVYFISHGGPPSMYAAESGPYSGWKRVGELIRRDIEQGKVDKSKGFICISAHWESDDTSGKTIEINTNGKNPLIYDYYNFPKHYYDQTFHSFGPAQGIEVINKALEVGGWTVKRVDRGLDHGLFVPFKIAFGQPPVDHSSPPVPSSETIDLTPHLVQVSLPGDSSPETAEKFGEVLGKLRQDGWGIVCTGQAVHNLRDLRHARSFGGEGTAYSKPFLDAFLAAATSSPTILGEATKALFSRSDYRQAHPTPEHLMPIVVAAGAAQVLPGAGKGDVIFQEDDGPIGWAMLRWE